MLLYEKLFEFFAHLKLPDVVQQHWYDNAGWDFAEALDAVLQDCVNELVTDALFVHVSLDKSTDTGQHNRMTLHMYVVYD